MQFIYLLAAYEFEQLVVQPTHHMGGILDLVITREGCVKRCEEDCELYAMSDSLTIRVCFGLWISRAWRQCIAQLSAETASPSTWMPSRAILCVQPSTAM